MVAGMKIVSTFKYLGLNLHTTVTATAKAAIEQIHKYVSIIRNKARTGVEGLDNAVISAYARSLYLFMIPPLIANNLCTERELIDNWVRLEKKTLGAAHSVSNVQFFSLTDAGAKSAVTQALMLSRRIKGAMETKTY